MNNKILVSWYSDPDFMDTETGYVINKQGPLFEFHQYFWQGYDRHILLFPAELHRPGRPDETDRFKKLLNALQLSFEEHKIDSRDISVSDPLDVAAIYNQLEAFIATLIDVHIEIYVSASLFPQMQVAWYLIGLNFKKNITVFQVRQKEYTKQKLRPEIIPISLDYGQSTTSLHIYTSKPENNDGPFITPTIQQAYSKASKIAPVDIAHCLILGDNGTGKDELASYIVKNSPRKDKPYKVINCASISPDLLMSEIFGHVKGAFTGASEKRKGLFLEAHKGTVFLDEIGETTPEFQAALLRVLEKGEVKAVGSDKVEKVDVRVLAATNRNLDAQVENGKFRMDLYYRLSVTEIQLPSLKELPPAELKSLIKYFNNYYFKQNFQFNRKEPLVFNSNALQILESYQYPGNIREMKNTILSLYVNCEGQVEIEDLPKRMRSKLIDKTWNLDENEKHLITKAFNEFNGNVARMSKSLNRERHTILKKLKEYGLKK
jgi:DNA-binding NtrC family response regulator